MALDTGVEWDNVLVQLSFIYFFIDTKLHQNLLTSNYSNHSLLESMVLAGCDREQSSPPPAAWPSQMGKKCPRCECHQRLFRFPSRVWLGSNNKHHRITKQKHKKLYSPSPPPRSFGQEKSQTLT